jgi:hypothetical protein
MNLSEVSARIVSKAIVDVNAQKNEGMPLVDSPNTLLLGEDGVIDSLAFAYLVVCIEQYAMDDLDREIILFDDEVMQIDFDSVENPFLTIGSLTAFVQRKLE